MKGTSQNETEHEDDMTRVEYNHRFMLTESTSTKALVEVRMLFLSA